MGITGTWEGYVTTPLYLFNNGAWSNVQTTGITHMAGDGFEKESDGCLLVYLSGYGNKKTLGRLNSSVSLTNYKYLNVYGRTNLLSDENICRIGVSQNSGLTTPSFTAHVDMPRDVTGSDGVYKIPISSLSGNYFIYLSIINGPSGGRYDQYLWLAQIFLSNT